MVSVNPAKALAAASKCERSSSPMRGASATSPKCHPALSDAGGVAAATACLPRANSATCPAWGRTSQPTLTLPMLTDYQKGMQWRTRASHTISLRPGAPARPPELCVGLLDHKQVLHADAKRAVLIVPRLVAAHHGRQQRLRVPKPARMRVGRLGRIFMYGARLTRRG
jgi:hypothetical protein